MAETLTDEDSRNIAEVITEGSIYHPTIARLKRSVECGICGVTIFKTEDAVVLSASRTRHEQAQYDKRRGYNRAASRYNLDPKKFGTTEGRVSVKPSRYFHARCYPV